MSHWHPTQRAIGAQVLTSLTGPQQVIGIVNEEMTNMLGGATAGLMAVLVSPRIEQVQPVLGHHDEPAVLL